MAVPTYAMYRIVSEQRGARVAAVPRLGPEGGFGLDIAALVEAARSARLVWLCEPNNPTGACEPPERIGELLEALASTALRDGREAPVVVVDEAYAEFVGRSVLPLRAHYPRLVVIRTLSKAHALAGIRVGFAIARPETLAPIVSYRAPASVGTVSAALATASLARPELAAANVARIAEQRSRLTGELTDDRLAPVSVAGQLHPGPLRLAQLRLPRPPRRSFARGWCPRTFGRDHPLADCLRLTVRSAEENDRLIDAARGIPA